MVEATPSVIFYANGKPPIVVPVEVRNDAAGRAAGLAGRAALDPARGMLFVFPRPEYLAFTLRGTLVPLDLVFIDDRGLVRRVVYGAPARGAGLISSVAPALFVLELPAPGAFTRGIEPGATATFVGVPHATG